MAIRNSLVLASTLLLLTACPERPSSEQAQQACENLISIAHHQKAASEAEALEPLSDEDQLQAALKDYEASLGKDKRATALAELKSSFKPESEETQRTKAEAKCKTSARELVIDGSAATASQRDEHLKQCITNFKPASNEAQWAAEVARYEKEGSVPTSDDRAKKIAEFKRRFTPVPADKQADDARRAAVEKLTKALAEQKASDPKYKETLDTCIRGLEQLGTTKQANCILKAETQKQAEACRNER